jgi:putative membrane protein
VSDQPVGDRHLHPLSIVGTSLKSLPGAIAGMIGSFTVLSQMGLEVALGVASLILLITLGVAALNWWRFTYRIEEREIIIEQGVLSRNRRVIPFDRVRDLAIERPLLARLAGTAKVRIETGGSKADEGSLDMIELDEAHALRDLIRRSNLAGASQEAAALADEPPEPVVFAMSVRRVLLAGLFNFSLIFIALLVGAAQYLDDFGIFDVERWVRSREVTQIAGGLGIGAALTIAALVLLLGVVSGVVRTLARDFGFRLTAGDSGLRRRRGLLTLSEVLIPARRTEAARIQTGWFSGWFGWHDLAFQTLGADAKEGGVQVAAPLARMDEVDMILAEAGFAPRPTRRLIRPPLRALVRRCVPWLLLALVLGAAALVWPRAGWAIPLPLLIVAGAFVHWRRDGYLVGENALYIGGGILRRRLWILPFAKLQTVSTSRSPLQRTLGLANVNPDLAGAPMFAAPDVEDIAVEDAEALARRLLESFYSARDALRREAVNRH